jgi:hypothetical protein
MASHTPPDDDRDAEVDPWADIIADGLTDAGDEAAFDFAALDARPSEPASDQPSDHHTLDHVAAETAAADLDGVLAAAAGVATGDSAALADDFFADLVGGDEPAGAGAGDHVAADDTDDVGGGLDDDASAEAAADGFSEVPALSVFSPDDAAGWDASSSTDSDAFAAGVLDDIASPESVAPAAAVPVGTDHADHADEDEEFAWATLPTADAAAGAAGEDEGAAWGDVVAASDDESDDGATGFSTDDAEPAVGPALGAAVGAAVATGGDGTPRGARRPARAKGGVGQFIGIVLGGALSIPIVIGVLIGAMWLGRPDPIGMRRWLPGASFLLPPARQARGGGGQQARDLDSLPTADVDRAEPVTDPAGTAFPAGDSGDPAAAIAAVSPASAAAAGDAVAVAAPTDFASDGDDPAMSLNAADRLAAIPAPAVPDLDALAAVPVGPDALAVIAPMPPEPEPLDLGALDAAVEQAAAAVVVLDGADADDPDRRRHMVAWYRSLSQVAEELAALEALAVESGRPFDEATVRIDPLMAGLAPDGPLGDDLVRLARNWLSFSRRDSDGAVLPVTFQSARPVGPYWCSKVVIEESDGEVRELAVVSRQRPFLETGERCVVTGVIFDGGTVWAADVRSTDTLHVVPGVGIDDAPPAPGATDGPAVTPPAADAAAPPPKAPGIEVPEIEVPEIPVPDIGAPQSPVPAAEAVPAAEPPAAGSDAPVADDF